MTLSRPRVLVLTPRFPYPVVGGDRLRIFELCKVLSQHADLTLLSLCETRDELTMAVPSDGVFQGVERVYLSRWQSRLNALLALPTLTPLQVAYYRSRLFADRVAALMPQHDLVLAHLIRTGDYVRRRPVPGILEMTDAISLNYQRVSQAGGALRDWRSLVYRVEARRLLRYERAALKDFERVLLVSDVDRAFLLGERDDPNVLVCSNGVDLSHLPFCSREQAEPVVVFIGNMNTVQNLDAAIFFAAEVLPLLRRLGPFRFRIIGRMDAHTQAVLAAYEGVELSPNVSSVADAASGAFAAVAPMRLGAGIQNKVLEYMALGLPCISSSVGFEGLSACPGEDLLLADSASDWARGIEMLWTSPETRGRLACSARRYVQENHDWTARLAPVVTAVAQLSQKSDV
ncbi:glycosyltransferase [Aquabacterium fontiphilum]|uniref:glycosyltransferase family 4 protein n=1 Tax=Aquabacterium fontiphilum TaxID=450365 RepID=UPI0013784B08|nr:glycosyltransferase family 4 protein [Aquabacterium fontiphilum]NBD19553.1 glycosyltransferase [Aquabacterium fontiphilum]